MWDTIKDLNAHKINDGFHHTTEIADAQVVLIIDAVCAGLQQNRGHETKERDAESRYVNVQKLVAATLQ